jgi:hypothetical protein
MNSNHTNSECRNKMESCDMLIKLYGQDFKQNLDQSLLKKNILIRKPIGPDRRQLLSWAESHFPTTWIGEIEQALGNHPGSCFIAQREADLLGFAVYDATALGFLGPLGVVIEARGIGIGTALTRACLLDMHLKGYGYAIVGMAGVPEFFRKVAGAVEIPDSSPGIYAGSMNLK